MKKAKCFRKVLISILLLTCFFFPLYQLKADSGFDGSYDSGASSSSSSSWSSSSSHDSSSSSSSGSSHNSSSSSNGELTIYDIAFTGKIVFIEICTFCILMIIIISTFRSLKAKKAMNNPLENVPLYNIEKLKKVLPNFDEKEFLDEAYKIYKDIQIAWMNAEMDKMRNLVNDALYNMYSVQVRTMTMKRQKNIMKDFAFLGGKIKGMIINDFEVSLYVNMKIECFDYIVDKDNITIRGNDSSKVLYNYLMVFTRSIDNKENKCPNCGATLESGTASICKYCHTKIINKNYDWVLSKKMVISQTENVKK